MTRGKKKERTIDRNWRDYYHGGNSESGKDRKREVTK